ncbi:MFS general substrate transporter, partial [Exidia glandulosa HHB12029]
HLESGGTVHYLSKYDVGRSLSLAHLLRVNLSRPFVFLVTEPIVTLISLYIGIVYAELYALFTSLPIVFQDHRHWGRAKGGVAYLGIGAGVLIAVACVPIQARLYARAANRGPNGKAPPEARLVVCCLGAVLVPLGLFWFAWTSQPSKPAIISITARAPFGFGLFCLFTGMVAYIMDTYTIYCASAIASTVVLRSVLAAIFPVIAPTMFHKLGDQWALSLFGFLALAGMPVPWLFYIFGPRIRARSKNAAKLVDVTISSQGNTVVPSTAVSEKQRDEEAGIPEGEGVAVETELGVGHGHIGTSEKKDVLEEKV